MSFFVPERFFDLASPEFMDRPSNDPVLLRQDLINLRRINKYFGGITAVRSNLLSLLAGTEPAGEISILDIATGSADHPIEIVRMMRSHGQKVRITAIDKNPQILEIAKERVQSFPEIDIAFGDALALTYEDKSFDIVLCSLAIHHFSTEDAVGILRAMNRLSRLGFILNDLNRSTIAAWTVWLYTHLTSRNPLTLNDSYISVLRAFIPDELSVMSRKAGIQRFTIQTQPFFRLILIGYHP
jgi:ubiquinone/menaquinone biosynthesis C-methylase UbiE